jgi:hypothetical protein
MDKYEHDDHNKKGAMQGIPDIGQLILQIDQGNCAIFDS